MIDNNTKNLESTIKIFFHLANGFDEILHTCQGITALDFIHSPENNQTVFKLTLDPETTGFIRAVFEIEYTDTPVDWTVNIGDSASNNGFGGDGGDQSNDAEMQVHTTTMNIYGNQNFPGNLLQTVEEVVSPDSTLVLEVSNEMLGWRYPGITDDLFSEFLYALDGQPDSDGPINFDIYAAFNRTIGEAGRNGSGVGRVVIKLIPEPPM